MLPGNEKTKVEDQVSVLAINFTLLMFPKNTVGHLPLEVERMIVIKFVAYCPLQRNNRDLLRLS